MSKTFWTAFFFNTEIGPGDLHVTHKYLGELDHDKRLYVQQMIRDHFKAFPFRSFKATFDEPDTFENKGQRVTVWKSKGLGCEDSIALLRKALNGFRKDDHQTYQPHVTGRWGISAEIVCYALMYGDTPVEIWGENSKLQNSKTYKRIETLRPIFEDKRYQDEIEKRIRQAFKEILYQPLMNLLGDSKEKLENASSELLKAIAKGKIIARVGQQQIAFRGVFSASISKELKALGATFDDGYFTLESRKAKDRLKEAIRAADEKNQDRAREVEKKLGDILPVEITSKIRTSDLFDAALFKTDKSFVESVKKITVEPQLTDAQRLEIANAWQKNMDLWVNDFTEKEIVRLRKNVQDSVFKAQRHDSLASIIQESYGVTSSKAKFLARQETNLLMAEFKKTRYVNAGVPDYIWGCVAGSPLHPVRASHKKLEGKIFSWNNPPITDEKNSRNNPGQDYGCRCFAKPVVRF